MNEPTKKKVGKPHHLSLKCRLFVFNDGLLSSSKLNIYAPVWKHLDMGPNWGTPKKKNIKASY